MASLCLTPVIPTSAQAFGCQADFKKIPEDFIVNEILGFEPKGEGEHVYLHIKKRKNNTQWVAGTIANIAGVSERDVGYCGRKDRQAVTTQWFSVYLPKQPIIDWSVLNNEGIDVISTSRHTQKLRRGQHKANQFSIHLRKVCDSLGNPLTAKLKQTLNQVFQTLKTQGLPNAFGLQRFGHNNLEKANDWLVNNKKPCNRERSIILSSARSHLFNIVLNERVQSGIWQHALTGDPLISGQPTGPLWGRGRALSTGETLEFERELLAPYHVWCNRLEHLGLTQERRALILKPYDAQAQWVNDDWQLDFSLPVGAYATSVLNAFIKLNEY